MSQQKAFGVEEIKTFAAGSGRFEALVSVFGNIDSVKDRVLAGAFSRAIKESEPPPVVWSHFWNIPPVGETVDWSEGEKGLHVQGQLFVGADDKHQYADMVYAAMKSREGRKPALREFSFSYDVPDGGAEKKTETIDGSNVIVNDIKEFFPVYEVGPCLRGCNPATEMIAAPKTWSIDTSGAELIKRLEKLAAARGKTLSELVAALEQEEKPAYKGNSFPRELLDVLTAVPGH